MVKKRGVDIRAGTHEAILDEIAYQETVAGVGRRTRRTGISPGGRRRRYLLHGHVYCSCGARMRGQARVARGREWRYYTCPVAEKRTALLDGTGTLIVCGARGVRADDAEAAVLAAVSHLSLPDEAIHDASEELRRGLRVPALGTLDNERARLRLRIENLRKQHEWGDLSDADYRRARADAEAQLAAMPDDDKLVMFDRHRDILLSMAENLEHATPAQLEQLISHLVERVETEARRVTRVLWTPPARPFFLAAEAVVDETGALFWRPRTDSNPQYPRSVLDYYLEVG